MSAVGSELGVGLFCAGSGSEALVVGLGSLPGAAGSELCGGFESRDPAGGEPMSEVEGGVAEGTGVCKFEGS